jgi:alkaline phosphatase D
MDQTGGRTSMPTAQVGRRGFLLAGGAAAAGLAAAAVTARGVPALAAGRSLPADPFTLGVASGDPLEDGVVLWTRLAPDPLDGGGMPARPVPVQWEVGTDERLHRVVRRGVAAALPDLAHSVHVDVRGLRPGAWYWYRFRVGRHQSPVGRTRTAPAAGSLPDRLRFAFVSCQNFQQGFWPAYANLAAEDLELVVHLGDYLYEEAADPLAPRQHLGGEPTTLAEYRTRHAQYKSDPALQAAHQAFPWALTWDDHEVQNNYANDADDGGLPLRRRFSRARRDAAYKAFFESMPVFARGRSQIYRSQRYGRTVELTMLDERQYREDQPCYDALAFPCRSWERARTMLGRRQLGFLKSRLAASPAAWKVIGGQSLIMPNRVHDGQYQRFDSWQGYPGEREELLAHIAQRGIKDVVFLAGDVHTVVAGDVCMGMGAGPSVAVEFASGSVTSATVGETNYRLPAGQLVPGSSDPHTPPEIMARYRALNPWYDALDLDRHGYGIVSASQDAFHVTLKRMWTVKERNFGTLPDTGFHWKVGRGQTSIKGTAS